ncbi:uncharacterized protein BO80DRAFT_423637 [Aspergillus ibericus CBS 121593]|uniref:Uncharacterized protein n=1 Tax=Aspergillus ibericus CBS 121593 TaxID=1448316 RepID=A0A395H920_9EURO|nr:hypothetical protein BO80DRAFT_423637 [Aspergillus ibericus CBS 121593]RAL02734.1 hypothetical protein BO80DRAFT_423637 [Aspergillus ibericus CBS 121593]
MQGLPLGSGLRILRNPPYRYTCEDTIDETIELFIDWAYRRVFMYPSVPTEPIKPASIIAASEKTDPISGDGDDQFMTHLRVYIFSDLYIREDLEVVALTELIHYLKSLDATTDTIISRPP